MNKIKIEATVGAGIDKVWKYWSEPEHITKWAFAQDDWEAPYAENDLRAGGKFLTRMSAKDGSASFDMAGEYTEVVPNEKISYVFDGREVATQFEKIDENTTKVVSEFDPENINSEEKQKEGWQGILDNFKKHVEAN
mgnify:FL=1